jgi:HEAT repeat protein
MNGKPTASDMDTAIQELSTPRADPGDLATRSSALELLLVNADISHPRLLAVLNEKGGSPAVILALPKFGRPESVPVLDRILRNGSEATAALAAHALAEHPLPAALDALKKAVSVQREETATAAADGLMLRKDPSACPELLKLRNAPNAEIRYHARQAALALGCAGTELEQRH